MSDSKGVQKVNPSMPVSKAPDFIKTGAEAAGQERLAQFVTPPLLKIVQKQSSDELNDNFGRGSTIITPSNVMVARVGEPFYIVPLIQYPEYLTWADIKLKGQVPPILERTTDPRSALARKATSKDTWSEDGYVYNGTPLQFPVRHVEHITYVVLVLDENIGEVPCVMSFARGSHKFGRNFASILKMRNADLFGCIFEVIVPEDPQKNDQGTWHVWKVSNPSEDSNFGSWVTSAEDYERYRKMGLDLETAYQNNLLRADYDPDDSTDNVEVREDM